MPDINDANSTAAGGPARPGNRPDPAAGEHRLLLLDAGTAAGLRDRAAHLIDLLGEPASGGLGGLAATARRELADRPVRAGVVAASPDEARERLARLAAALRGGDVATFDVNGGVFAGRAGGTPAIGFLFPGQGSDSGTYGDALTRRFESAGDLYRTVPIPAAGDPAALGSVQPRIVASSIAGVRALAELGIEGSVAAGHSLGELTALQWAGAMSESELFALAAEHGRIMMDVCTGAGTMAVIGGPPAEAEPLLHGEPVVVAGYNNPAQTVVAGPRDAVGRVLKAAAAAGLRAAGLPVSDAFHSPAMAPAAEPLRAHLAGTRFRPLERRVLSTVTGHVLPPATDLRGLLVRQLCEPVRFSQAVERMGDEVSLILEVGPGRLLSVHAAQTCPGVPVIPLATDGETLSGVLCAAAAAYVLGAPVRHDRLAAGSTPHEEGA
ncbi:ACP S-malonyltransferase [Spirillospora sp. NPDC029432]|uniref:ACP S-malonyltransferase n=1 Tax=Spirillospora sp. NPDC029432 TaxID=3154599 RepID=UPI003453FB26